MTTVTQSRNNVYDLIRSFSMISMVLFHFSFDYFVIFKGEPAWYFLPVNLVWQQSICLSFILVSGVCLKFDKHPFKRGLILNACGMIVTAVTMLFMPEEGILFGIMTFFGCATILGAFLKPVLNLLDYRVGCCLFLALFCIFRSVNEGALNLFGYYVSLPIEWYQNYFTAWLGFPFPHFVSADYFPILPWFFWYCFGVCLGQSEKLETFLSGLPVPSTRKLADKSLIVYMLHQPICYLVAFALFKISTC